ncbi:MAG TPA: efflux RND transporter periplasmic adaptor subunit [Terriglobales bacterium]|nr:efflux RND transporter periplasmic adaptor subunit [Terriglobales bacterium]
MKKVALALAALSFALAGCGEKKPVADDAERVRGVQTVTIQRSAVPDEVEAVGTVHANQSAQLSAQIVASVRAVNAVEGRRVRRGDVLLVLDDAATRAAADQASAGITAAQQQAAAADANYGLAQATFARYQAMYEKKSVSPHEMDEAQARYKAAAAQRDAANAAQAQAVAGSAQARAMLGYTRIRAPFDGVVTAKNVDPGALAAPGAPLVTVEDTSSFRLEVAVDESDLRYVQLGGKAPVVIDALGEDIQAAVQQVVPAADPGSRSFVVKLALPKDARLHSGLFGRARFPRGQRDAVVVPRTAVVERGQMQGVYVVGADGAVALRFITLGRPMGERVEILSGLSGGERLVAAHGGRDLAGKKVD